MPVGVYEVIFTGRVAGQFVQDVLHMNILDTLSGPPYSIAKDILELINVTVNITGGWCNMLPEDYTLTSIRCRQLRPVGGPTAIILQSALNEDTGQRSGNADVSSNSPLIIWIPTTGPARTGRVFVPGVSQTDVDENVLTAALVTEMESFAQSWKDGGTTPNLSLEARGSVYRRIAGVGDLIDDFRVSPVIGNQRRRLKPI